MAAPLHPHSAAVSAIARRQDGRSLARTGVDGSGCVLAGRRLSGPEKPQSAFCGLSDLYTFTGESLVSD